MAWQASTHDYGSIITAYHVEYSPVTGRQRWQRAYSGVATSCQVSCDALHSHARPMASQG